VKVLRPLAAAGLLALWPAHPFAQQPVFRSTVDTIAVDVSVHQRGRPVADLTAAEFEVRDNGVLQAGVELSREQLPIEVTLVIDLSGSVSGRQYDAITRAVAALREKLRPDDRATVITFNERVRHVGTFSGAGAALTLGAPGGLTSLFDAATLALITAPEPGRRRMAILFTDGYDMTSFQDSRALVDVARRADTAVFSVALTPGGSARPPHRELFETLAERTGGAFTVLSQDETLSASFVQAFEDFRASYLLRYPYQGPLQPGWHTVSVRVLRRGEYDVRARQGYFAAAR
jgi:VWFA-related protein